MCSCCGETFVPEELEVCLEEGEAWPYCERCLYTDVAQSASPQVDSATIGTDTK